MSDGKATGPDRVNDQPRQDQTNTDTRIIYRPGMDAKSEFDRRIAEFEAARRYLPARDKIALQVMDRVAQKIASVWRFKNRLDRMPHSIVPCSMPPSVIPGRTEPFRNLFFVVLTRAGNAIGYPDSMMVPLSELPHIYLPEWCVNAAYLKDGKCFFTDDDIEELQATGGCTARRNYVSRIVLTLEPLFRSHRPSILRTAIARMRNEGSAAPQVDLPEWLGPTTRSQ